MTSRWLALPTALCLLASTACADNIPTFAYYSNGGGGTGTDFTTTVAPVPHEVGTGCSLADGIVGWWAGENDLKDSVGVNDGVWSDGTTPAYAAGKIGEAFLFGGVSYVRAPFTQTGPLTIDLWARAESSIESDHDATFASGDVASQPFFQIDSDGMGNFRLFAQTDLNVTAISTTSAWQHLAVTYDGTTVTAYADGKVAGAPLAWGKDAPLQFSTLKIGSNRATNRYFVGAIDEVHIWSRALSDSEIATLAAVTTGSLCPQ